jgi:glycine cleavage system H protein
MVDGDYSEFSIAHDRKYTLEHLWLQALDDKAESVKVGISEFVRAEYGEIIRVVLTRPEDDSEFKGESDADDTDDDILRIMGSGDEVGVEDLLITLTTSFEGEIETLLINAPFPCKILELNGEVEDNPDLLNDDAYGDGWCVIVQPHEFDEDQFLDQGEYIEMLNELP